MPNRRIISFSMIYRTIHTHASSVCLLKAANYRIVDDIPGFSFDVQHLAIGNLLSIGWKKQQKKEENIAYLIIVT